MKNEIRVYTNDLIKAKKLFEVSLLKEGRLSFILYPELNCLLYITKAQQDSYEKLKMPKSEWPHVLLNDDKACVAEFEKR